MVFFKNDGKRQLFGRRKSFTSEDGLWIKCEYCGEIIYKPAILRNKKVCLKCRYHFRLTPSEWMELLLDETGEEIGEDIRSLDFLNFHDSKPYGERLKQLEESLDVSEAVKCVLGRIKGKWAGWGFFDFRFMGGSLGSVAGERLKMLFERCAEENLPVITVSSSGGARMQEGTVALMQMAKTVNAVIRYKNVCRKPFISVMSDPTSGGVAASFASLGDVIIAEPKALIGFAGPRVIKETIRQELPEGFQRAEFMFERGFIDLIVERTKLKDTISDILEILGE